MKLWDPADGSELWSYNGHTEMVRTRRPKGVVVAAAAAVVVVVVLATAAVVHNHMPPSHRGSDPRDRVGAERELARDRLT